MLGDELPNEMQVGFANDALPVPEFGLHARQSSSPAPGTQDPSRTRGEPVFIPPRLGSDTLRQAPPHRRGLRRGRIAAHQQ
jgi:hypothetical protein